MARISLPVIVVVSACALAGPAAGGVPAASPRSTYVIQAHRLSQKPVIDGRMDDKAWADAALVDHFTQLVPEEGAPASEKTEVRVGYDDDSLYLGFRCFDSDMRHIMANILKHDEDLSFDDYVNVILDTYSDGQNGFLFASNALGAKSEAIVRKQGEEVNLAWDGLWECAGSRDSEGWTVEMRIPFKTLRFPEAQEQNWGLNFGRFIARKREEAFWTPVHKSYGFNAKYHISQYGRLAGLQGVRQGLSLQVEPHVVGELRDSPVEDSSVAGGVDAKFNLASNLVADVTYKTDFAEVEADQVQLNLTRFRLYYPEKRDFFLEGADIFYVGERPEPYKAPETSLFFSRQIGLTEDGRREIPVLAGAKVTGRVGDLSMGLLNITTDSLDTSAGRLAPRSNFTVARLRQDVFGTSTVGLLALNKDDAGSGYNRVLGGDWDLVLHPNLRTGGFLAKTWTPGLEGDDWAGYGDVYLDTKSARARVAYTDIGDNFNDEVGFLTRTGVRKWRTALSGILWPEGSRVRQATLVHYFDHVADRAGNLQTRVHNFELSVSFQNSSGFALKWYDDKEVLDRPFRVRRDVVVPPGAYDFGYAFFGYQSDYSKKVGGTIWLQNGGYYDGRLFLTLEALTVRPLAGLLTQFIFQHTHVKVSGGEFDTNQLTGEVNYSLSPGLIVRATLQWLERATLRVNAAINWEYRPGSNLYLVYNETRLLPDGITWVRDRSLALKATYAFGF